MDTFHIILPLKNEYMTTVRLTVGGLCALKKFDVDATEDCKLCVTESLLILKRGGFAFADVTFTLGEKLLFVAKGQERGEKREEGEDEISLALLNALVSSTSVERDSDGISKISFEA